jgi:hypothetical protein
MSVPRGEFERSPLATACQFSPRLETGWVSFCFLSRMRAAGAPARPALARRPPAVPAYRTRY